MTQEVKLTVKEAIERLKGYPDDTEVIGLQISLLKEPKSALQKLMDDLNGHSMHPSHLPKTLDRLGLRIVEK